MKLYEIAHARTGDKGNISTISLIAYKAEDYPLLERFVSDTLVLEQFRSVGAYKADRYCLPDLHALNFVLYGTLDGGVTRSLALDAHGKTLSALMLDIDINPQSEGMRV